MSSAGKQETNNTNIARGGDTAGKEGTVTPLVSPMIINYDSFYYCATTPYHSLFAWSCIICYNQTVDISDWQWKLQIVASINLNYVKIRINMCLLI